eukprot:g31548.t1
MQTHGPALSFENFQEHSFGNLFIQSQGQTGRTWTNIGALKPEMKDAGDLAAGPRICEVHNTRKQGNKLCFLTLRQDVATVQAVTFGQERSYETRARFWWLRGVELSVEKIFCIGRSQALPLRLADASRSEAELEKDPSLPTVGQDVRLDNRIIDLRTVANQAIFRLQSGVCELFREFLLQNKFQAPRGEMGGALWRVLKMVPAAGRSVGEGDRRSFATRIGGLGQPVGQLLALASGGHLPWLMSRAGRCMSAVLLSAAWCFSNPFQARRTAKRDATAAMRYAI